MSEAIVRLTSDHIKVKGGEYVRDLVRCKECKYEEKCNTVVHFLADGGIDVIPLEFCSYGEVRDE